MCAVEADAGCASRSKILESTSTSATPYDVFTKPSRALLSTIGVHNDSIVCLCIAKIGGWVMREATAEDGRNNRASSRKEQGARILENQIFLSSLPEMRPRMVRLLAINRY